MTSSDPNDSKRIVPSSLLESVNNDTSTVISSTILQAQNKLLVSSPPHSDYHKNELIPAVPNPTGSVHIVPIQKTAIQIVPIKNDFTSSSSFPIGSLKIDSSHTESTKILLLKKTIEKPIFYVNEKEIISQTKIM